MIYENTIKEECVSSTLYIEHKSGKTSNRISVANTATKPRNWATFDPVLTTKNGCAAVWGRSATATRISNLYGL